MKLIRFILILMLIIGINSCNDEPYFNTDLRSNPIEEDIPFPSLFDQTRATYEQLNGECVIRAIMYCVEAQGHYVSRQELIDYFGEAIVWNNGNIRGIYLNSASWLEAWEHWCGARMTGGLYDLINKINNEGYIALCRLGNYRSHAVVLLHADDNLKQFTYYDPVLRTHKTVSYSQVADPVLVNVKRGL